MLVLSATLLLFVWHSTAGQSCYPALEDSKLPAVRLPKPQSVEELDIKFTAYTSQDPASVTGQNVDPCDQSSLEIIDTSKPVAVLIHGYGNIGTSIQFIRIKDALQMFADYGAVIIVDWRLGANYVAYPQAAGNTRVVALQTAYLINQLRENRGLNPDNVHVIGFSLGGETAGFVGKITQNDYDFTLGRITGLDPAGPAFNNNTGTYLTKADAKFVDVIHTSYGPNPGAGDFGFTGDQGHVDFYPNGGKKQPHCELPAPNPDTTCNHFMALEYFRNSLLVPSNRRKCSAQQCRWNGSGQLVGCGRVDSRMGFYSVTQPGRGPHYVDVGPDFPYCKN